MGPAFEDLALLELGAYGGLIPVGGERLRQECDHQGNVHPMSLSPWPRRCQGGAAPSRTISPSQ